MDDRPPARITPRRCRWDRKHNGEFWPQAPGQGQTGTYGTAGEGAGEAQTGDDE